MYVDTLIFNHYLYNKLLKQPSYKKIFYISM